MLWTVQKVLSLTTDVFARTSQIYNFSCFRSKSLFRFARVLLSLFLDESESKLIFTVVAKIKRRFSTTKFGLLHSLRTKEATGVTQLFLSSLFSASLLSPCFCSPQMPQMYAFSLSHLTHKLTRERDTGKRFKLKTEKAKLSMDYLWEITKNLPCQKVTER